jgi:hypothetical protein
MVKYKVNGTPLHNGDIVYLVSCWNREWEKDNYRNNSESLFQSKVRDGWIPCYNPKYSSTMFWWFAPCQLENVL